MMRRTAPLQMISKLLESTVWLLRENVCCHVVQGSKRRKVSEKNNEHIVALTFLSCFFHICHWICAREGFPSIPFKYPLNPPKSFPYEFPLFWLLFIWEILYKHLDLKAEGTEAGEACSPCTSPLISRFVNMILHIFFPKECTVPFQWPAKGPYWQLYTLHAALSSGLA